MGPSGRYGTIPVDQYERRLYNTVKFQLEETIREYLRRTRRPYPIHLIFDMSHVPLSRF